ncbi:MAG: glycoside hydrolase family 125 protein [Sedimentisphaeraceae bacterium JB056]
MLEFQSKRPAVEKRTFNSMSVEALIKTIKSEIVDPELAWMFENCFPNTLDTTVDFDIIDGKPDTFVITGDIDAMWLRDSTCQVWPYMPLINEDSKLREMIKGLVHRQVKCVILDPYANAFYKDINEVSRWNNDIPKMKPGVHERKWEIDSLCYVVRLAYEYWQITGDKSVFDDGFDEAMHLIVETFRTEQRKDSKTPYRFKRTTDEMTDAPLFEGTGRPVKAIGLICSMFRPSDDATLFPFLIPSNLFAAKSLEQIAQIYSDILGDLEFSKECSDFSVEIKNAVNDYAIVEHLSFGEIYAYEVDGFGNKVFMDDANVPSLMSLPYIGVCDFSDEVYQQTRKFLLSDSNPYFISGKVACGQGSPHTGKENIWPMGIILRALTSNDADEIKKCLSMLKVTHNNSGFMHESFHKDDCNNFSRSWFAWANTLFGELICKVYREFSSILKERL